MYALLSAARAGQHKCDRARALSPRSASLSFFRSNWNTFDFVCVAASYAELLELIDKEHKLTTLQEMALGEWDREGEG